MKLSTPQPPGRSHQNSTALAFKITFRGAGRLAAVMTMEFYDLALQALEYLDDVRPTMSPHREERFGRARRRSRVSAVHRE